MKIFAPRSTVLDEQLLLETQVKNGVDNYLTVSISNLLCTALICIALNTVAGTNQLHIMLWAGSQLLLSSIWIGLYFRYSKDCTPIVKYWLYWIKLPLSVWGGATWGIAWVVFIDPSNLNTAFILNTMICGVVLGMVAATPLNEHIALAALLSCLLPVFLKSLMIGEVLFYWAAGVAFTFLIASYSFCKKLHKLYYEVMEEREKSRQLAIALEHEKKQIEKISQSKTRFLASASHDLRQPIQAIYFFQSALTNLLNTSDQKKLLSKINEANTDLSKMLEPLLDISKLDSGVLEPHPEVFWVDDLFHRAEQNYRERATEKGIELRVVPVGQQQLFADSHHLERILNNLIENALKHMGRSGKVLVGLRSKGEYLSIEVHDNGKGIPDSEKDKIFDEFYQVGNAERNSAKGLGLGLPIVRRLAELNGGTMSVTSKEGKGSCFKLVMPMHQSDDLQEPAYFDHDDIDDEQSFEMSFGGAPTIFVVEDEPKVAQAQAAMLESWGSTVRVANNIESALEHLDTTTPDLIISDYQLLDNETGLQVVNLIREQVSSDIPAVIVTGNTSPDIVKALSEQSIPVLYKPVKPETLKSTIFQMLEAVNVSGESSI